MKPSALALAGALVLAAIALPALHVSAQEQVDMRSTLAAGHGQAHRPDEQGYAAPAPTYAPYRPVTAHGRYGMRYSGYSDPYAARAADGGYPRDVAVPYPDGRGAPQLISRGGTFDGYGRDSEHQSYGGGPLMADRRSEYGGGHSDVGEPRYGSGRDDGGGAYDPTYDQHHDRQVGYEGAGSPSSYEPYGYRGGRGYAGPYGYGSGYETGGEDVVRYRHEGHIDRYSGFVAPPPHDSRDARELRDACGCDDEDDQ